MPKQLSTLVDNDMRAAKASYLLIHLKILSMAATKAFYAYFDFPDMIRINTVKAYIYNVVITPDADQTTTVQPASTAKVLTVEPNSTTDPFVYGISISEEEFSEYYYFVGSITSYYDSKGILYNVDEWVVEVMAVLTHNDTNFYIGPHST